MNDNEIICEEIKLFRLFSMFLQTKTGCISNDDVDFDGNARGKKVIGLDLQNNNPLSRFFAFLTVATRPRVKTPNFTFCGGHEGEDISDCLFFP